MFLTISLKNKTLSKKKNKKETKQILKIETVERAYNHFILFYFNSFHLFSHYLIFVSYLYNNNSNNNNNKKLNQYEVDQKKKKK